MIELSNQIADKLLKKGFTHIEIPDLLNDLIYLIKENKNYTTSDINQELENLGWGIQIIDASLCTDIVTLIVSTDVALKQN
jgi:hypothetical protein